MAGNYNPVFSKVGDIQSGGAILGSSANTAQDGTGANMYSIFQADSTNGGFVQKLRLQSVSTCAATVVRVYICSVTGAFTAGTSNTVATNWLIAELALASVTVSQTAAGPTYELPLNVALPPGYRLCVSFGTSTGASTTGYICTVFGGKF